MAVPTLNSQLGVSYLGRFWVGSVLQSFSISLITVNVFDSFLIFDSMLEINVQVAFAPIFIEATDVIQITDTVSGFGYGMNFIEQLPILDSPLWIVNNSTVSSSSIINLQIEEFSLPLVDYVATLQMGVQLAVSLTFSETLPIIDQVLNIVMLGGTTPAYNLLFNDSLALVDGFTTLPDNVVEVFSDTLPINDANGFSFQLITLLTVSITGDQLNLLDYLSSPLEIFDLSFSERIVFSDSVGSSTQASQPTFSDQIVMSDSVGLLLVNFGNTIINDTLTLSDSVIVSLQSIFVNLTIVQSDTITMLDSVNAATHGSGITIFTDVFVFQDSIFVSLQSNLSDYLRRYLNDVVGVGNP